MKAITRGGVFVALFLGLAVTGLAQVAQPLAPKLAGFAVQGLTINLDAYKGKQNVVVLFYRTYN